MISIAKGRQNPAGLGQTVRDASFNNLNVNDSLVAGEITSTLIRSQQLVADTIIADGINAGSLTVNGVPVVGGGGGGDASVTLVGAPNEIVTIDATGKLQVPGGGTLTSAGNLNLVNGGVIQFGGQTAFKQSTDKTSIAVGTGAGGSDVAAPDSNNTILGHNAGVSMTMATAVDNVCVGRNAGAEFNSGGLVAVGSYASRVLPAGTGSFATTSVGIASLFSATSSTDTTAIGGFALTNATSSDSNVAVGAGSMQTLLTGSNNTAIGTNCDTGATTTNAVVIGRNAQAQGNESVSIGASAVNPGGGVVIGYQAGDNVGGLSVNNVVIGHNAKVSQVVAPSSGNVVIGNESKITNTAAFNAQNNTIVGSNITMADSTLSNCILLGSGASVITTGSIGLGAIALSGFAPVAPTDSIVVCIGGTNYRLGLSPF